jgi:hypothetical protein
MKNNSLQIDILVINIQFIKNSHSIIIKMDT